MRSIILSPIAVLGQHEVDELRAQREHRQAVAAAEADDAARIAGQVVHERLRPSPARRRRGRRSMLCVQASETISERPVPRQADAAWPGEARASTSTCLLGVDAQHASAAALLHEVVLPAVGRSCRASRRRHRCAPSGPTTARSGISALPALNFPASGRCRPVERRLCPCRPRRRRRRHRDGAAIAGGQPVEFRDDGRLGEIATTNRSAAAAGDVGAAVGREGDVVRLARPRSSHRASSSAEFGRIGPSSTGLARRSRLRKSTS